MPRGSTCMGVSEESDSQRPGWGAGARDSSFTGDRVSVNKDENVWRRMAVMAHDSVTARCRRLYAYHG